MTTVIMGMVIGYLMLVPLATVLQPMLFHTRGLEPIAVMGVALLGIVTAVVAAAFPARAVLRTDVMAVLRE